MIAHPNPSRLERLKLSLAKDQALLIEDKVDLYYLTGFDLSAGKLLITPEEASLLVDSRYFGRCSIDSPCPVYLLSSDRFSQLLSAKQTLQFDSVKTSYQRFLELSELPITLAPVKAPIEHLRAIKDEFEIAIMRQAAKLCTQGMEFVKGLLREGITELELARLLEIYWLQHGGQGLSFDSIIAFGPNSAFPHYRGGNIPLKMCDTVLLDMGVTYQHYQSDMTRTVFFGEAPPRMQAIWHWVDEAKRLAASCCKPGITAAELDQIAREFLVTKGVGDQFLHGLGHGVGLDIHEFPGINSRVNPSPVLQKGMVITIEPGVYIEGLGGVRLEDTYLISETGVEALTG